MLYFKKNMSNMAGGNEKGEVWLQERKLQTHGYRCKDSLKILNPVIIQIDKCYNQVWFITGI